MKLAAVTFALLALLIAPPATAKPPATSDAAIQDFRAPKDAVILIIRHAEKPEHGPDLSPAGQRRAQAYPSYFKEFTVNGKALELDTLYATADSKASSRPRLTVEPLSKALGLKIHDQFKDKEFEKLAADITAQPHEKNILICWHHGEIPELLRALGANPEKLLPSGKWPAEQFGWVLQLRYDQDGRLIPDESRRIDENLKLAVAY